MENKPTIVLVTGKTGAGKSWLINALMDKEAPGSTAHIDAVQYLLDEANGRGGKEKLHEVLKTHKGKIIFVELQELKDAHFLGLDYDRHIHLEWYR
ncbi:hypothetical protein D6779_04535 [Candidatus Parcubacteria bacterium]|nr:MAG: hypothetical protein D6779_04535 [Candidatus Parcubacteria bacterium]